MEPDLSIKMVLLGFFSPFPPFWLCGKLTVSEQQWGNQVLAQRTENSQSGLSGTLLRSSLWSWGQPENGSKFYSRATRGWVEVVHLLLPDSPATALVLHTCWFLVYCFVDAKASTTPGDPEAYGLYLSCPGVSWQQLPVCHWTYLSTNWA